MLLFRNTIQCAGNFQFDGQSSTMQKKRRKKKQPRKKTLNKSKRNLGTPAPETRASEALTVCWGVTLTILVVCNLVTTAAYYYVSQNPEAERTAVFGELLLLTGSLVGGLSLLLLPVLYRVRRVPPPRGVAVFGACLAIAPILALLLQTLR
ncbi:MAG: hypothetical protein MI725_12915 [Pirellulales bacterium]|nr:hypothetical protein [Pirellulales bacterium]